MNGAMLTAAVSQPAMKRSLLIMALNETEIGHASRTSGHPVVVTRVTSPETVAFE
jgi:hypothetical protein